ncbi:tectonic [Eurosta solidaginis]|uniref:tectonic n=1 Tax=Eurosta solidaginis TaxID=178769 RepID=UPI003530738A
MEFKLPKCAVTLLLLLHLTSAVKIGISKINIDTNSTTTTTISTTTANFTETATEESTTITYATEIESSSTTLTTTTMKPKTTQTKPNFTISIFPPRLKTTKMPKITTTSTSTAPTTAIATTSLSSTDNSSTFVDALSTKKISDSYYCACDLTLDACDINCCCDRDCIPATLHIFNCNTAAMAHHTELKNRLEDFQYEHGLPSCKVNEGWLCVFRTNIQRDQLKEPKIDWDLRQYYKWATPTWGVDIDQRSNENLEHYKYGEALQFLNMETIMLSQLDLPHTFKPPHCQIKQTVKFLKAYKTNCLLGTIEELQTNARTLVKFIQKNQILLRPLKQASELEHITPISSDFKLKICQKQLCAVVPLNNSTAIDLRLESYYPTEIKLSLLHNYTQLLGAMVELRNTTYSPLNNTETWQRYQVEYIYKNVTVNEVNRNINETAFAEEKEQALTSGPLGYLVGEPIIIARFIVINESDESSNEVLNYFHANSTKSRLNHTLPLFTTQQGKCANDISGRSVISYGINTLKQCKLRYSEVSVTKLPQNERNYTKICMNLQKEIISQLFGINSILFDAISPEIFISQLGRPANASTKWTKLHIQQKNYYLLISGEYNAQSHSFSCRNMLINIAYEFLVGHFSENDISHQALVKQATLIFGERNDLEFDLDELIEVPLMITVMFFDFAKDVSGEGSRQNIANIIWGLLLMNFVCKQYFSKYLNSFKVSS